MPASAGTRDSTVNVRVIALVPAAGRGERLGEPIPKALVQVRGDALVTHAVRGLLASGLVQSTVVAAPADSLSQFAASVAEFGDRCRVVPGGGDRASSVRLALSSLTPDSCDAVLVHDAARAFTPVTVIRSVVDAIANGARAVVPVVPVTDTIKAVDDAGVITATADRTALRAAQTPQGFAVDVLRTAYEHGLDATDDAGLVERLGETVHTVPGHHLAMKITTPFDLAVAEAVLCETLTS